MMRALAARIWHELTRERGSLRVRAARTGRSSRSGVAILLVISILALMMVVVTEVVHGASVRIQLAANQRDEAKAEALAQGGVQFYRLLLIGSKQLDNSGVIQMINQYTGGMLPNAAQLWQLVPTVSTGMLRLLLVTDGDVEDAEEIQDQGGLTDEQIAESREEIQTSLRKPFLDFDGDFTASVKDEDGRIYVGALGDLSPSGQRESLPTLADLQQSPHGLLVSGLMLPRDQEEFLRATDIDPWELIANLADWTDPDDNRLYLGGRESVVYERLDDPYLPKNAPFDSVDEIRLVDGWESDAVWDHFGKHLTIYGSGKVNVNTANRRVLEALLFSHVDPRPSPDCLDDMIEIVQLFRNTPPALGGGIFNNPRGFVQIITPYACGDIDPSLQQKISTNSSVFRVTSRGEVGKASVSIEAVFDFSRSPQGKVVYWRVQ